MSRKAFTLVELLVVISIIAILVAIMLPSIQQVRNRAKVAVCSGNLHAVGAAVGLYMNDFTPLRPWFNGAGDGNYDLPWECARSKKDPVTGKLIPDMGNPACALTKDGWHKLAAGDTVDTDPSASPTVGAHAYLPNAKPFFCPLMPYTYEKNYSRQGGFPYPTDWANEPGLWGTYQWNYPLYLKLDRKTPAPYANPLAYNLLMMDTNFYPMSASIKGQAYWHFNALMLDGSVQLVANKAKDSFNWMFLGEPPGYDFKDPEYFQNGNVYTLREDAR